MSQGLLSWVTGAAEIAGALQRGALRNLAALVVAGVFAAVGAGFMLAAGYIALVPEVGAIAAAAIIGAGLLAVSGIIALRARRQRPTTSVALAVEQAVAAAAAHHAPQARAAAADPMTTAVFVAAFVLARQLSRRG